MHSALISPEHKLDSYHAQVLYRFHYAFSFVLLRAFMQT